MELTRCPSVVVVSTAAVSAEDRGLLLSIVEPTLELHRDDCAVAQSTMEAIEVPIGNSAVLVIPVGASLDGYTTPPHGDRTYSVMYSPQSAKRERDEPEGGAGGSPAARLSLTHRFDIVAREGAVAELRDFAAALGGLHFDDEPDQILLERLSAMVSKMADDVASRAAGSNLDQITPMIRGLRKVILLMGMSTRGEVLMDTLRVFSVHAHELSGSPAEQADRPSTLELLLSRRRLTGFGVVPASPSASTHSKRRCLNPPTPVVAESGGPLADHLTTLLELLVNASAENTFAPEETTLAIGRIYTAIGGAVVAMGEKVPRLAAAASTLIPRISNLKEYILRLPPGLTEQAIAHLQALSAEAQADAHEERVNPTCIVAIRDLAQALERAGGALGLLGDACARLTTVDLPKGETKRLAENDLADLWTGLLWLGDTMAPVISTVDDIGTSLSLLDRCIHHIEQDLHPDEVIRLLGTVMEYSMQATRTVAKLVKPGRGCLLPRLMASVEHATELASEGRAAIDAVILAK